MQLFSFNEQKVEYSFIHFLIFFDLLMSLNKSLDTMYIGTYRKSIAEFVAIGQDAHAENI